MSRSGGLLTDCKCNGSRIFQTYILICSHHTDEISHIWISQSPSANGTKSSPPITHTHRRVNTVNLDPRTPLLRVRSSHQIGSAEGNTFPVALRAQVQHVPIRSRKSAHAHTHLLCAVDHEFAAHFRHVEIVGERRALLAGDQRQIAAEVGCGECSPELRMNTYADIDGVIHKQINKSFALFTRLSRHTLTVNKNKTKQKENVNGHELTSPLN